MNESVWIYRGSAFKQYHISIIEQLVYYAFIFQLAAVSQSLYNKHKVHWSLETFYWIKKAYKDKYKCAHSNNWFGKLDPNPIAPLIIQQLLDTW